MIVVEFIASLKVALTAVLIATPVAALAGTTALTVGAVGAAALAPAAPPPPCPHPVIKKTLRIKINKRYVCRVLNLFMIIAPPFLPEL
jgi:hypothetical protein